MLTIGDFISLITIIIFVDYILNKVIGEFVFTITINKKFFINFINYILANYLLNLHNSSVSIVKSSPYIFNNMTIPTNNITTN